MAGEDLRGFVVVEARLIRRIFHIPGDDMRRKGLSKVWPAMILVSIAVMAGIVVSSCANEDTTSTALEINNPPIQAQVTNNDSDTRVPDFFYDTATCVTWCPCPFELSCIPSTIEVLNSYGAPDYVHNTVPCSVFCQCMGEACPGG